VTQRTDDRRLQLAGLGGGWGGGDGGSSLERSSSGMSDVSMGQYTVTAVPGVRTVSILEVDMIARMAMV
jgi:hypothetical protein